MVRNSKKHLNTYSGGMNKDLSHNLYDNKKYLHSEWLTPINNETGDIGKMVNPKGTIEKISLPDDTCVIIGEATLRDIKIIVFVKDDISGIPATYITKFIDDGTTDIQTLDTDSNFVTIYTDYGLPDEDKLGYTSSDKLDIVTRYETDIIQKIYIACEGFPLRYMNIIENEIFNNYSTYTQSDFNIIPNVNLSLPEFVAYESGNLSSGMISYSYQQYKKYGTETSFSGTSQIFPISSTINEQYLKNIKGSDVGENCGIGIRIRIDDLDTNFDGVRILAFHYTDYNAEPEVRICYEGDVYGSSMEFIDTGKSLGNYDLGLFRIFHSFIPKPKHLATKNNILFPANMQEEYFDLDYYLKNSDLQYNQELLSTDPNSVEFYDTRIFRYNEATEETTTTTTTASSTSIETFNLSDGAVTMIIESNSSVEITIQNIGSVMGISNLTNITGVSNHDSSTSFYGEYDGLGAEPFSFSGSSITYTSIFYNSATGTLSFVVNVDGDISSSGMPEPDGLLSATLSNVDISYTYTVTNTETTTTPAQAIILDSNGDSIIVNSTFSNVPYNHDCINKYNDVAENNYYVNNPSKALRYDKDGNVGGSGKNIDLKFGTRTGHAGEIATSYTIDGQKPEGWRSTSYQRDEIYALSIQFEDYLGRKSYPKWMLDCRMPNHGEEDYHDEEDFRKGAFVYSQDGSLYFRSLYPQIKLKNVPKNPDGTYMNFRVLRTKRTGYDKTVLGTAIINPIVHKSFHEADYFNSLDISTLSYYYNGFWIPPNNDGGYDLDKKFVEIMSPEINFNKDFNLNSAIIKPVGTLHYETGYGYYYRRGHLDEDTREWERWDEEYFSFKETPFQVVRKFSNYIGFSHLASKLSYAKITDSIYLTPQGKDNPYYYLGGRICRNGNSYEFDEYREDAEHGTHIAAILDRNLDFNPLDTNSGVIFCLIKKDTTPYGGNTYNARLNREYIPASIFTNGDDYVTSPDYVTASFGDTYLALFDYLRGQLPRDIDYADKYGYQEVIYMPCETQINLNLRNDESFSKMAEEPFHINVKLTEDGLVDTEIGVEVTKLYNYNPVYSRENDVEIYKPIVENNTNNYEYDYRIRRSQIKYNGEFTDSWLKFLPDDFLDVDSQYNEITDILVFRDKLLYFQETGFGTVPVGEKELIPSNNSASLALGSSGILNRYDYLSDKVGVNQKEAILVSPNALYFFSNINNTMYKFTGNNQPISDIKGMNSWFDEYVDIDTQVRSGYNSKLNEVLYSFGNYVLVFNELSDNYTYFYPYDFQGIERYISFKNDLYTINMSSDKYNKVYKHNVGDRGYVHNTYYDSKLTIIVNPDSTSINVYNVIEFLTRVLNTSEEELNETFTSIKIYNDYQTTGEITLSPNNNIKRRFRTWRFNKIRGNTTNALNPRIRSDNIKIELKFTNTDNKKILVDNIITNYSPSKMLH